MENRNCSMKIEIAHQKEKFFTKIEIAERK
jgi:hypothetical protein